MATPPSTLTRRPRKQAAQSVKGGDGDEPTSISESEAGKDEESCSTSANQINEEMQRMLNQLWVLWLLFNYLGYGLQRHTWRATLH